MFKFIIKTFDQLKKDNFDQVNFGQTTPCHIQQHQNKKRLKRLCNYSNNLLGSFDKVCCLRYILAPDFRCPDQLRNTFNEVDFYLFGFCNHTSKYCLKIESKNYDESSYIHSRINLTQDFRCPDQLRNTFNEVDFYLFGFCNHTSKYCLKIESKNYDKSSFILRYMQRWIDCVETLLRQKPQLVIRGLREMRNAK